MNTIIKIKILQRYNFFLKYLGFFSLCLLGVTRCNYFSDFFVTQRTTENTLSFTEVFLYELGFSLYAFVVKNNPKIKPSFSRYNHSDENNFSLNKKRIFTDIP